MRQSREADIMRLGFETYRAFHERVSGAFGAYTEPQWQRRPYRRQPVRLW
jgi:hypothetical protein